MQYAVIDLVFSVEGLAFPAPWPLFSVSSTQEEPVFSVQTKPFTPINRDISFLNIPPVTHLFETGGSIVAADAAYRNFYVVSPHQPLDPVAMAYLFYTHAVRRKMLHFHAAVIDAGGNGVLFLGPSGVGKTTMAERWAQYRNAAILNGDVGFVQYTKTGYLAWGTPWHGSSPYCLNASVPLKALVVLKQAPCNTLRELTGFEKVAEVSSHVFYPTWLEDGMDLCSDTLNHLLSDLPVYRLDNRADEEAVALLAKELDRIS